MSAERSYKDFSEFISQFINSGISVLKVLLVSDLSGKKVKGNGKTAVVLGNGPSLKTSLAKHKDSLREKDLFCVNSFSLSAEYTELRPANYVILDHSFWKSEGQVIIDSLNAIETKTSWPLTLFVPRSSRASKRFESLAATNPNISVHYFNYTVFKGFSGVSHWFYKKNLAMPQSQNVLVAAIFLALNSGSKEVIVVGADHTWHENLHLDENNNLSLRHIHFYDNVEKATYIPFKKSIHEDESFKVHQVFAAWAKVFYGYVALENYSGYLKSKVYNSSEVTFVDAFERKKL